MDGILPKDGIHRDFDIPNNVLGFTVAAAGTSFPNVFSGMCVARQGKAVETRTAELQRLTPLMEVVWVVHYGDQVVHG